MRERERDREGSLDVLIMSLLNFEHIFAINSKVTSLSVVVTDVSSEIAKEPVP